MKSVLQAFQFSDIFRDTVIFNLENSCDLSAEDFTILFNITCCDILDSVAPFRTKHIRPRPGPWLYDSTHALRRACRCAERKWKKDRLQVSLGILRECLAEYQRAIKAAKTQYMSELVSTNCRGPQVLFKALNSLIQVHPIITACIRPSTLLRENFLKFSTDKISALRSVPTSVVMDPSAPPYMHSCSQPV